MLPLTVLIAVQHLLVVVPLNSYMDKTEHIACRQGNDF